MSSSYTQAQRRRPGSDTLSGQSAPAPSGAELGWKLLKQVFPDTLPTSARQCLAETREGQKGLATMTLRVEGKAPNTHSPQ